MCVCLALSIISLQYVLLEVIKWTSSDFFCFEVMVRQCVPEKAMAPHSSTLA